MEQTPLYTDAQGQDFFLGSRVRKEKKPFKSGEKVNTVAGLVTHPVLNIPAFTFEEDESYVECRRCILVESWLNFQPTIPTLKMQKLTYHELLDLHREALTIWNSELSAEAKYDLIFSDRVSAKVPFTWYDPDTSYEEDVEYFMKAFNEYMGKWLQTLTPPPL